MKIFFKYINEWWDLWQGNINWGIYTFGQPFLNLTVSLTKLVFPRKVANKFIKRINEHYVFDLIGFRVYNIVFILMFVFINIIILTILFIIILKLSYWFYCLGYWLLSWFIWNPYLYIINAILTFIFNILFAIVIKLPILIFLIFLLIRRLSKMNLNSIPERREIPLWLSRLLFETDYTVKILAFFGGPIAMGMICLFTNYGITAALFGLLLILIIFNIVMDQRFINFVFKYSIWFNEASMQLHDSLVQMNNWWLDRSNWWLDRSGIKNENNNTPWLNNEALKGKVHDYEPYHGPKADGKIAGFNSILTQYNSLFSSAYNIPSFNLLNQNLDSNLPTVQIDDGILSASIQNLHIGIPLGTLLQWSIMQDFKQKVDLLVEQMKLNHNSKVISSLLNRPEMKSMFRIPPVNDNLFSPYSKLSSNLKLVRGPKGQRTFSTIIKTSSPSVKRLKGYLGYNRFTEICLMTDVLLDNQKLNSSALENLLRLKIDSQLEENKIYNGLFMIYNTDIYGKAERYTLSKAIKLGIGVDYKAISERLIIRLNQLHENYQGDLGSGSAKLMLLDKIWLSEEEYNSKLTSKTKSKILNYLNESILSSEDTKTINVDLDIQKIEEKILGEYKEIQYNNYGDLIKSNKDILREVIENDGASVYKNSLISQDRLLMVTSLDNKFKVDIISTNYNLNNIILSWTDEILEGNILIRTISEYQFYYNRDSGNQKLIKVEKLFNFPNMIVSSKNQVKNTNFGSIDLETLSITTDGEQETYAGGYCIKSSDNELGYIQKTFMSKDINELIIENIIDSIFDYIKGKEGSTKREQQARNGLSLYAHNLSRFDSLEIIKGLINIKGSLKYEVEGKWKTEENKLLSLRIKEKESKFYIKLIDSVSFFNFTSLDKLLKTNNIDVQKGKFPHSFIKPYNLNYVGNKPAIEYYNNISIEEYDNIPLENWNIRTELTKYLESDIIGLFKLIELHHDRYYEKYNLNMMDFITFPSFAKAIFTSNYYNEDHEIKVIKGRIEDQIRTSYLGGMIHVRNNKEIHQGFHYDMNSQYPNAMLQDMPTGNPILTSEKDLNKLFGFSYGLITPPSESELKVPLLRQRIDGETIYPRKPYKAMIFTELIKEAIKYGYKFEVEFSYNFNRTADVFKKYVLEHYKDKQNAKDVVTRNISKLLLNSLYGKFGMKEIDSNMKILPIDKALELEQTNYVDYMFPLNSQFAIVKYRGRLPNEARQLFMDKELNINVPEWTTKELSSGNVKGVQSSIPIASAIASYAAASMFKYMNIKGNNLIYMDTDSAVLEKPLSKDVIGKELLKLN